MKHSLYLPLLLLVLLAAPVRPDEKSADARLHAKLRTLNDKDFFLRVPASKDAWIKRRQAVREQMLVALGLWPLPVKTPLQPVIHGKIDRDDYTIEKVFFASYPGHYVSGDLYRPKGKSAKLPGVLCPHGHWANGRFYDADDKAVAAQIKQGAEKTPEGAKYPLQARCAQLARMGCVVFHYDMVGYADSAAIEHRKGFTDANAELRLQSFMGLQTWNSIRALDFLLSLPEVDPQRIGVTGASGGGTQTMILCAIDDRPTVAFPAVMVSTAMQGGCVCENCSHLRVGTGNVEFAALFAPKPLAMSGANDWTIDIERKGLPELKELYKLYGAEDRVLARCFPQFQHNYNQVSREVMYNWFNKHLQLGLPEPVVEKPFKPVPPKELSVYDESHPRPADSVDAARLRQYLTEQSDKQIEALLPKDEKGLAEYRRIFAAALRAMIHDELPDADQVKEVQRGETKEHEGYSYRRYILTRKGQNERIPGLALWSPDFDGTVVIWIHPRGKASLFQDGKPVPAVKQILDRKSAVFAVDVFGTGELALDKPMPVDKTYAGFTFGYNRTLVAERVHDILTAIAFARNYENVTTVHCIGFDKAGPWVLLARGLCGDAVTRTAADYNDFRFDKVRTTGDEMMLPGGLKYSLPALAALAAPGELYVHNHRGSGQGLKAVYEAAGAKDKLQRTREKATDEKCVEWLLR
ncbi:MAG TPA: acetylxylan esterase [Gemmataceae bacterium]|nr:acetylxylan esterase [Gemmataceae bacterium]